MQWFLTLFSTCLPRETVLRVWDLILLEGNEVLLRTALAIWTQLEEWVYLNLCTICAVICMCPLFRLPVIQIFKSKYASPYQCHGWWRLCMRISWVALRFFPFIKLKYVTLASASLRIRWEESKECTYLLQFSHICASFCLHLEL